MRWECLSSIATGLGRTQEWIFFDTSSKVCGFGFVAFLTLNKASNSQESDLKVDDLELKDLAVVELFDLLLSNLL